MSLKKGIFYTLIAQVPTVLLFFIASTLITRSLGDEGRGAYALLISQIALWSMLLWINAGSGITYFTSRRGIARPSIVGIATSILLFDLLVLSVLLLVIRYNDALRTTFMPGEGYESGYYIFIFLSIMASLLNNAISAILLGLKKFRPLNMMSIMNAAFSATAFSLLYLFKGNTASINSLPDVLAVTLGAQLAITLIWCVMYIIYVGIPPVPVFAIALLKPLLTFSLLGYLSNLVNLINYRFDVWVVDHYHGTASLGLYAVAVGVGQLLFYVPEPFSRVVQPYLYGRSGDEMMSRYKAVARVSFSTVLLLAILLGSVAPIILPILFGPVFEGSVLALRLLLPGILFSSAFKVLAPLVLQKKVPKFNLYATSAGALVTIVLDFLLIPAFGIEGAAIASTFSYLTIMLTTLWVIRSKFGIAIHDLFIVRPSDLIVLGRSLSTRISR